MAREYFCAYHSYFESLRNLTDEECGRLFRALLRYSATGELPTLLDREAVAFDFMRSQLDRDREAYEAKCRKNAESIRKRYERKQPNTNVYESYQRKGEREGKGEREEKGERRKNITILSSNAGAAGAEEIEMLRRLE